MTREWTCIDKMIIDENGFLLAHVSSDAKPGFRKKLRIITVAPEMLEALEGAKWLIESYVSDLEHSEEYQDICAVIKKARGEE